MKTASILKTASIRWLMVFALAFYASGVAQFVHEATEHAGGQSRLPTLVERALHTAAPESSSGNFPGSNSSPQHHHNDHNDHNDHHDCPVCQMIAAMHFAPAHLAPTVQRPEPSVEFVLTLKLLHPTAPVCDDSRLARPPPFAA